jgi:hypothetical protein
VTWTIHHVVDLGALVSSLYLLFIFLWTVLPVLPRDLE